MIFGGIVLLIVAVICFFWARSQAGELHAMNAADTYTAQMASDLHGRVAAALGTDALAQVCDIEGVIECDAPLSAPLSGTACVAYTYSVTREYEEDVTATDAQGKTETRTERRSESLQSDSRQVNFWLRDATGRTLVIPESADLDLVSTGNRFDPAPAPGTGRTRTLGQRVAENALPVGSKVYVLGCVIDHEGQPAIARSPRDAKARFMISRKSERELTQSAAAWARGLRYVAAGSGAIGLLLLAIGFVG
ncbi:MAG TPA: E3 ubiquitin ligase family protein [Roseiflexaceae bacterium]|nr:E3 ubiquitin ligase family protein [Roseiflexaceae bacterium]